MTDTQTYLRRGRLPLVAPNRPEPLALEDGPRALGERLHQGREPLCVGRLRYVCMLVKSSPLRHN